MMKTKSIKIILVIVAVLLLVPLITMQFTDEVNWTIFDFLIMAVILLGFGFLFEFAMRKSKNFTYRLALGIGLLGAFLLFWVNAAVGIIGNEGQPANLLFGLVFLILIIGIIFSGFKPKGMAHTFFLAAIIQMLVPAIALIIWPPSIISWAPSVLGVFILTAFFSILFAISGILFLHVENKL